MTLIATSELWETHDPTFSELAESPAESKAKCLV